MDLHLTKQIKKLGNSRIKLKINKNCAPKIDSTITNIRIRWSDCRRPVFVFECVVISRKRYVFLQNPYRPSSLGPNSTTLSLWDRFPFLVFHRVIGARQRERARSRFAIDIKSNGKCSDASNSYSTNSAWVDTEKNEWKKHPTHPTRRIKSFCLRCWCCRCYSFFSVVYRPMFVQNILCSFFSSVRTFFQLSRAFVFSSSIFRVFIFPPRCVCAFGGRVNVKLLCLRVFISFFLF